MTTGETGCPFLLSFAISRAAFARRCATEVYGRQSQPHDIESRFLQRLANIERHQLQQLFVLHFRQQQLGSAFQ